MSLSTANEYFKIEVAIYIWQNIPVAEKQQQSLWRFF